ncbi:hypothetical protein AB0940_34545 [Streptomyces sp. NPDC006656]|uniref:hypothetical protein n=1 Tax=Streptomyces sp. NPDC006656 TaxID=3156899 RepID=UPI003454D761
MINFDPDTNAERAANGDHVTGLYTEWAIEAGSTLTVSSRAALGLALAEVHSGGPVDPNEITAAAADVLADLFHSTDGRVSPHGLLTAACDELASPVNMAGPLLALGQDGRTSRTACAAAAVLAYVYACGLALGPVLTLARNRWAEEVEAERFAHIQATRHS